MRRSKLIGTILGALFVLMAMAASASALALPDISLTLTGGAYPLQADGALSSAATSAGTASGVALSGKGVSVALLTTELSALGTFAATFSGVEEPANKEKCKTGSEPAGTVVATGEFHIVPLTTTGTVGELYLVSFLEITCGTIKVKFRGNVLATLNAGSEGTELTKFGGVLEGSNGAQKLSEYLNDTGSKVKANLESDAGLEFVKADANISGELSLSVEGSKMIVITGR